MDQEHKTIRTPQEAIDLIDYTLAFKREPGEMLPTRRLSLTAQQFEEIYNVLKTYYAGTLESREGQDVPVGWGPMAPRFALTTRVDKIENRLAKWDDRFRRLGRRLASSESLIARIVSQLKAVEDAQDATARRLTNMIAMYGPELDTLQEKVEAHASLIQILESKAFTLGEAVEAAATRERQREIDIGPPLKLKPSPDHLMYLDLESLSVSQVRDLAKQNQHDLKLLESKLNLLESKLTQAKIDWSADWKRIWKRDAEQKERMDDLEEQQDDIAELAAENKERLGKLTAMVLNPTWPHVADPDISVTATEPVTEGETNDPRD